MLTVILTGGKSRRMGRDKAMLPWHGGTLLQSLIDRYRAVLGEVAVSVNEPGRFSFNGAKELTDRFPGMGPLNGIVSGFENTSEETLFLTATDLPFGDPGLVLRLNELMGSADACVMRRGVKGFEPLFALYRRSCMEKAEKCFAENKKSFRDMLEMAEVRYVQESELCDFDLEHILCNVNTPEEWERAVREYPSVN